MRDYIAIIIGTIWLASLGCDDLTSMSVAECNKHIDWCMEDDNPTIPAYSEELCQRITNGTMTGIDDPRCLSRWFGFFCECITPACVTVSELAYDPEDRATWPAMSQIETLGCHGLEHYVK